jgi:hypothetical protein
MRGNCAGGSLPDLFQPTSNAGACLTLGVAGKGAAQIKDSRLHISVECGGGGATTNHRTIVISGDSQIYRCYGQIAFGFGGADWAAGDHLNKMWFTGNVHAVGDPGLASLSVSSFRTIGHSAGNRGYMEPTGAIGLASGNWFLQRMTAGAQTISIDVDTGGVTVPFCSEFDLFIQQPASGSTTLTWPGSFVWVDGAAPVLSSTANAIDWIRVSMIGTTYYAKHVNNTAQIKSHYDSVTATMTNKTLTAPKIDTVYGPSGGPALQISDTASAVNLIKLYNAAGGFGPSIEAVGPPSSTNIPLVIATRGTGRCEIYANALRLNEVNIPTVSSTDTLTNKSLTTPVITGGSGTATIRAGTGTPEGVVTATVGSLFMRTDGGAATTLYVKESGTGNTGWVAK